MYLIQTQKSFSRHGGIRITFPNLCIEIAGRNTSPRTTVHLVSAHVRTALKEQHLANLRQIETERGVGHDIATLGRSIYTTP
jgi:hypothetical protein